MSSSITTILDKIRYQVFKNHITKKYAEFIEERTKVHVEYILVALAFIPLLLVFYGIGANTITNLVGFIYPLYATIISIETTEKNDDTEWLIYWVVYGFLGVIEGFVEILLYWIPFYYPLKLTLLLWLQLPQFGGSKIVYKSFVLPNFKKAEDKIDEALNKVAKSLKVDG
mmetsp:Transcript_15126/g.13664  ORF Transcript_15126/g.13664 Transcript_15126/m.13664 type:complete len:170 (-) Transcript_15126:204-713(-)